MRFVHSSQATSLRSGQMTRSRINNSRHPSPITLQDEQALRTYLAQPTNLMRLITDQKPVTLNGKTYEINWDMADRRPDLD